MNHVPIHSLVQMTKSLVMRCRRSYNGTVQKSELSMSRLKLQFKIQNNVYNKLVRRTCTPGNQVRSLCGIVTGTRKKSVSASLLQVSALIFRN